MKKIIIFIFLLISIIGFADLKNISTRSHDDNFYRGCYRECIKKNILRYCHKEISVAKDAFKTANIFEKKFKDIKFANKLRRIANMNLKKLCPKCYENEEK